MARIYTRNIDSLIKSDSKSRVFLSYLKIRSAKAQNCGGFNLKEAAEILEVSDTTARKHIKRLLNHNYILEVKKNLFRIVSFKAISGSNNHERYVVLPEAELRAYNWRNIAAFRAYLVEIRIEQNRRYRKTLRKGYSIINKRDKSTEKIKSHSKIEYDTLMAADYVSQMTGKSMTTVFNYRKKQNVCNYSKKVVTKQIIKPNEKGQILNMGLGKYLYDSLTGSLIFIPISKRSNTFLIKGY